VNQPKNPIIICSSNANLLSKYGMTWQFYMVSLLFFMLQRMQPLNGGVGKEIHGDQLLLLSYGVHGDGGTTKSSKK